MSIVLHQGTHTKNLKKRFFSSHLCLVLLSRKQINKSLSTADQRLENLNFQASQLDFGIFRKKNYKPQVLCINWFFLNLLCLEDFHSKSWKHFYISVFLLLFWFHLLKRCKVWFEIAWKPFSSITNYMLLFKQGKVVRISTKLLEFAKLTGKVFH